MARENFLYPSEDSSDCSIIDWLPNIPWSQILIGLILVLALVGFGWVTFHTSSVKVKVAGYSWTRDIAIEQYSTVHESGWSSPTGAYNISTSIRMHYNFTKKAYTYDIWHEYDIDKWVDTRTIRAEGFDRNPFWPKYTLNFEGQTVIGAERINSQPETYTVNFKTVEDTKEQKNYSYTTDQAQWMRYSNNATYVLKINSFGEMMNNPLEDYQKANK